jgi:meso-butanediol dehydrogenase / (S,S)-butanediol dehydrogenase / diacetyl reductase
VACEDCGIAVVTGAGSGIGRAIARKFIAQKWPVLVVEQNQNALDLFLSEHAKAGDALAGLLADVAARDAPEKIYATCRERLGRPTCLVNNAGLGNAKSAVDTTDEDWNFYLDLNLGSMFRMCRAAAGELGEGGTIVNLASVFGIVGFRGSAAYSAAKAGVVGLTRQLAADLGPKGIRVNAVAPGAIVTPATIERLTTSAWLQRAMIATAPLGRAGQPEDVAEAVYFLGSPAARHITAVVLPVDGGWSSTRFYPDLDPE